MSFKEDLGFKEVSEGKEDKEKREVSEEEIKKVRLGNIITSIVVSNKEKIGKVNDLMDIFEIEYRLWLIDIKDKRFYERVREVLEEYEKENRDRLEKLDLEWKVLLIEKIVENIKGERDRQRFWRECLEDYEMYLDNIKERISFKIIREDDERLKEYGKRLKKEIIRIKYYNFLWRRYPESKIREIFKEEYKITQSDIFHPLFWIKVEDGISIWRDYKKQQEVLTEILRRIMLWYNSKESIKYKVQFLKYLRQIDRYDEDYNYYNSYPVIRKEIGYILLNLRQQDEDYQKIVNKLKEIGENKIHKEKFEKLLEIKDEEEFIKWFSEYLKQVGIDLQEDRIESIWKKIFKLNQQKDKIKQKVLNNLEEEFILKLKVILEDIKDERLKKEIYEQIFDGNKLTLEYQEKLINLKERLNRNFENIFINILLEEISYSVIIDYFKEENKVITLKQVNSDLYELYKDVFTGYEDEEFNKVSELTYNFLYTLMSMYIWWLAAIAARTAIVEWVFWWAEILSSDLLTLYKANKGLALASIPYRTKLLITEWLVFDGLTQTMLNVKKAGEIKDIIDNYSIQSTIRTIIFLWVLRWLSWVNVKNIS